MSDLSPGLADEIADALFDNASPSIQPVANVYVTVFDDTNTDLEGDLSNGRIQTSPSDWQSAGTSAYENAVELDFGEALVDLSNVQDVALYDSDTGGSNNELARYTLTDAPFDVATGTRLFFEATELSFDVRDRTQ